MCYQTLDPSVYLNKHTLLKTFESYKESLLVGFFFFLQTKVVPVCTHKHIHTHTKKSIIDDWSEGHIAKVNLRSVTFHYCKFILIFIVNINARIIQMFN